MQTMQKIQNWVSQVKNDEHETVKAGQPFRITEACTVNDRVCQGDFNITVAEDKVPEGYILAENPQKQLVFGNNIGARHCLDSLEGVEMYVPENWNEESLNGPFLRLSQERTIEHPKHGDVTIPAGFAINCTYQREYDEEQKRERRARD